MFASFETHFRRDDNSNLGNADIISGTSLCLARLLNSSGGQSFNDGLYRVVRADKLAVWKSRVVCAFPDFTGRIECFGFDWLGRVFAIDSGRVEEGWPAVLIFEPGTGQALEVNANIFTFHNKELVDFADAALAEDFFRQWKSAGHSEMPYDKCAGYRQQLFLGGKDSVDNLEISDLDVYWHLCIQLIRKSHDFGGKI